MAELTEVRELEVDPWWTTPVSCRDKYGRVTYALPAWGKAIAVKIPRGTWFVNLNRWGIAPGGDFDGRRDIVDNLTRSQALAMVIAAGRWERNEETGEWS